MNYKLLIAVVGSVALAGCASVDDVNALSAQVDALEEQVSALEAQNAELADLKDQAMAVSEVKQMAMSAEDEAARANERLDNLAQSYTK